MTTNIVKRSKPLSVSPLKASQTLGAVLAFLGVDRAIPLMHGAQGCTAFSKIFFTRHFRDPIPVQTTAMDQISAVMGADDNIIEALRIVCSNRRPSLIGLPTTALAETEGADVHRAVKRFRECHPEFNAVRIVPVSTPDYCGSLESGYAAAVRELINALVLPARGRGLGTPRPRRALASPGSRSTGTPATGFTGFGKVNVLAGSLLTVGDVEALKELIETFGLQPIVVPDLADSLDGHLSDGEFNPLTYGGVGMAQIETLGQADATLVVGRSMANAADLLRQRTHVPDFRFDHLCGLEQTDALVYALHRISGRPVPKKIERQRTQLQDAMVDTHFMIGQTRVAIAAEADQLLAFSQFLSQMGAEIVAAVAPAAGPALTAVPAKEVLLGDLEDLEKAARVGRAELLIGNSHAVDSAQRLGVPILRAGFPQFDYVGGYQRTFIGYRGARQLLFDLANQLAEARHHAIAPYHSVFSQKCSPHAPPEDRHHAERDGYTAECDCHSNVLQKDKEHDFLEPCTIGGV